MVAIPAITSTCDVAPPFTRFNSAVLAAPTQTPYSTWLNNLTDSIGVGCYGEDAVSNDTYNVPPNIESTNPEWVNVGTSSVGTESTPPVGTNFALAPGSKAIGAGLTEPYLPSSSVEYRCVCKCADDLPVNEAFGNLRGTGVASPTGHRGRQSDGAHRDNNDFPIVSFDCAIEYVPPVLLLITKGDVWLRRQEMEAQRRMIGTSPLLDLVTALLPGRRSISAKMHALAELDCEGRQGRKGGSCCSSFTRSTKKTFCRRAPSIIAPTTSISTKLRSMRSTS